MQPLALRLSNRARDEILAAAARAEPREACGVAAGQTVLELPNRADGLHGFEIDVTDLAAAVESIGGWDKVTAVWHSHTQAAPSPLPSPADEAYHPVGKIMIIAHRGEVYSYGDEEA